MLLFWLSLLCFGCCFCFCFCLCLCFCFLHLSTNGIVRYGKTRLTKCFDCFFHSDRKVFLATWKDVPAANEVQNQIANVNFTSGKTSFLLGDQLSLLQSVTLTLLLFLFLLMLFLFLFLFFFLFLFYLLLFF